MIQRLRQPWLLYAAAVSAVAVAYLAGPLMTGPVVNLIGASAIDAEWPIPTTDGTTWQYEFTREGETEPGILTRQVFVPKNSSEENTLRIETAIDGIAFSTEFMKNEGNALLATAYRDQGGKNEAFDPAVTILPGELNIGAEWNYHGPIAGLDLNLPLKIVGEGEIDVPAGKFRALHFRGEKNEGLLTVADFWFVRGVGSIKETVTQRSPDGNLLGRNTIELLNLPARQQTEPIAGKKKLEASVSTSSDGDSLNVITDDALQIVARWRGHGLRKLR